MRFELIRHPDTRCDAVARIEVEFLRPRPTQIVFRYLVTGKIDDVLIPAPTASGSADELWRHTCFEAFLKASDGFYCEYNFSPSSQWAAYGFNDYREGMTYIRMSPPPIDIKATEEQFELQARADDMKMLIYQSRWRLGMSAVIEEKNGAISYWALAHPPGKPDFHHDQSYGYSFPGLDPS